MQFMQFNSNGVICAQWPYNLALLHEEMSNTLSNVVKQLYTRTLHLEASLCASFEPIALKATCFQPLNPRAHTVLST